MLFCCRIKLHMNNPKQQEKYNASYENNQLVIILNYVQLLEEQGETDHILKLLATFLG